MVQCGRSAMATLVIADTNPHEVMMPTNALVCAADRWRWVMDKCREGIWVDRTRAVDGELPPVTARVLGALADSKSVIARARRLNGYLRHSHEVSLCDYW